MRRPPSARDIGGTALRALLAFAALSLTASHASAADIGISVGTDAGITLPRGPVRFVDPNTRWDVPKVTVALGIDLGVYVMPRPTMAVGLAMTPTLGGGGPEPSPRLNFAWGGRFVWRPGRLHLASTAQLVGFSGGDRCTFATWCPTTVPTTDPVSIGFGTEISPLVRVFQHEGADLLVGPTLRYQTAKFTFADGAGDFWMSSYQIVLGVRGYLDFARADVPMGPRAR